ncbi:hypothetical protein WAI453_011136 [Rhynchosporium graminicola]
MFSTPLDLQRASKTGTRIKISGREKVPSYANARRILFHEDSHDVDNAWGSYRSTQGAAASRHQRRSNDGSVIVRECAATTSLI